MPDSFLKSKKDSRKPGEKTTAAEIGATPAENAPDVQ
jgi:hypothetical protein